MGPLCRALCDSWYAPVGAMSIVERSTDGDGVAAAAPGANPTAAIAETTTLAVRRLTFPIQREFAIGRPRCFPPNIEEQRKRDQESDYHDPDRDEGRELQGADPSRQQADVLGPLRGRDRVRGRGVELLPGLRGDRCSQVVGAGDEPDREEVVALDEGDDVGVGRLV